MEQLGKAIDTAVIKKAEGQHNEEIETSLRLILDENMQGAIINVVLKIAHRVEEIYYRHEQEIRHWIETEGEQLLEEEGEVWVDELVKYILGLIRLSGFSMKVALYAAVITRNEASEEVKMLQKEKKMCDLDVPDQARNWH